MITSLPLPLRLYFREAGVVSIQVENAEETKRVIETFLTS